MSSYHFQCAPQNSAEDIGEPQLILCPSVIRQFNEIRQGVFVKYEGELVIIARPIGYGGSDVEEDPESNLMNSTCQLTAVHNISSNSFAS